MAAEKEKKPRSSAAASKSSPKSNKEELDKVEANIEKLQSDKQAGDAIIQKGNKKLEKVVSATSKHIRKKSCNFPNLRLILGCSGKRSVMKN